MKRKHKLLYLIVVTVVAAAVSLFAVACNENRGSANKYTVTFIVGSAPYETVSGVAGSELKLTKSDPTKLYNVFDGWSLEDNGEVVELPTVMPDYNTTYYAVFSARYELSLDAGIGTLENVADLSLKAGANLYEAVSTYTPSIDGDLTFAGWFYNGKVLDAQSDAVMPSADATVTAKYYVDYTLNVRKQAAYKDAGNYTAPETVTGKGYVGEVLSEIPAYDGYCYNENVDDGVTSTALAADKTANVFNVYYDVLDYPVLFNANLPEDVEVEGEMTTETYGYQVENAVPECLFSADGYRFEGWATSAMGNVEFREGKKFSIVRVTTLYAVWVKGLSDIAGESSDLVYIKDNADGTGKVAYLERFGFAEDIAGDYDAATGVFTFKNDAGAVLLRGVCNFADGTYVYLDRLVDTEYKFRDLSGNVDNTKLLKLNNDGSAVYTENGDSVKGTYEQTVDENNNYGSLQFVSQDRSFLFRLGNDDGEAVFAVRGEEYGSWNKLTQTGNVDLTYLLRLDGYGVADMYVTGYDSGLQNIVTTRFRGYYDVTSGDNAYKGDAGEEFAVSLYNGNGARHDITFLLMKGEYKVNAASPDVYNNVYLERITQTFYGRPADGEELDQSTADTIVLDGYGIFDDGATYTYTDNDGSKKVVTGKYEYDENVGTLRLTAGNGDEYMFDVRVSGNYMLFASADELFGQYIITGLENAFYNNYRMYVYSGGEAVFAFRLPVSYSFYGNIAIDFFPMFEGSYKLVTDSANPADRVYEFTAEIDPSIVRELASLYYYLAGRALDVTQFGSFRFKFDYADGAISGCSVDTLGDFQRGGTVTYNNVLYTLDGFGKASAGNVVLDYVYNATLGLDRLFIDGVETAFVDVKGDHNYYSFTDYAVYNAGSSFRVIVSDDDDNTTALVVNTASSTSYYPDYAIFSCGKTEWENGDKTFGKYVSEVSYDGIFKGLSTEYDNFKFGFTEITVRDEKIKVMYLYDVNEVDGDGKSTVTAGNGSTLTIDRDDMTAVFVDKSTDPETTYSGSFSLRGDVLVLHCEERADDDSVTATSVTLKLIYSGGNITSFVKIRDEAGYWLSLTDERSYLYLSGETANGSSVETPAYNATYFEYDEENDDYIAHAATYTDTATQNAVGFDLTYGEGEEQTTFTFRTGIASGVPVFQTYSLRLGTYTYRLNAFTGQYAPVGALQGGGYESQTFTYGSTRYTGTFEEDEEASAAGKYIYRFTPNGSNRYFLFSFVTIGGNNTILVMLDGTVGAPNYGDFVFDEEFNITVRSNSGSPQVVTLASVSFTGWGRAELYYYAVDGTVASEPLSGYYAEYGSGTYGFFASGISEDGAVPNPVFRFRLYVRTVEGEDGSTTQSYVITPADIYAIFTDTDLRSVYLDGFQTAYYADANGVMFAGQYRKLADNIVVMMYIDTRDYNTEHNLTVKYLYFEYDEEEGTFTILDPDDPKIPEQPATP